MIALLTSPFVLLCLALLIGAMVVTSRLEGVEPCEDDHDEVE